MSSPRRSASPSTSSSSSHPTTEMKTNDSSRARRSPSSSSFSSSSSSSSSSPSPVRRREKKESKHSSDRSPRHRHVRRHGRSRSPSPEERSSRHRRDRRRENRDHRASDRKHSHRNESSRSERHRSRSRSRSEDIPSRQPVPRKPVSGIDTDWDMERKRERELQHRERLKLDSGEKKPMEKERIVDLMAKFRSGGVYIPPAKLRMLQEHISTDQNTKEYQRLNWDRLRKSINGLVNKVNVGNIKNIIPELFKVNMVRGRGLFCRSVMKAQASSPAFTHIYTAIVSVINSKFPDIGELVIMRVINQFRKAFKRNDKLQCLSSTKFIAHLVNQQIAHEILALQLLALLLENPSDDSVEVAVNLMKEVGHLLGEVSPQGLVAIFDRFRSILHEGEIDKRVQYMIEGLFLVRKRDFEEFPTVIPELDLVDNDEQITHEPYLDMDLDLKPELDYFQYDSKFSQNEERYATIRHEILGSESEGEGGALFESESEDEAEDKLKPVQGVIQDRSEQDLVQFRREVYLTIMSSVDFEECAHKLLKFKLQPGQEMDLCIMILECCSQEKTYLKFYGLLGQRFANLNISYQTAMEELFAKQYETVHRLETTRIRNVSNFFGHLMQSDAISWGVLECIQLSEDSTTAASRIFIKYLMQHVAEFMGLKKLTARFQEPSLQTYFSGLFPRDNPRNTRFSINFFTSIGLGIVTEDLRQFLKSQPKMILGELNLQADSDSDSSDISTSELSGLSSSDLSSSESDSGSTSASGSSASDSPPRKRSKK